MGDSITLGVGLPEYRGRWTDMVAERTGHTLVNFGIGGDTTSGMLARCQNQIFNQDFDAMILLGGSNGNTAMHGQISSQSTVRRKPSGSL